MNRTKDDDEASVIDSDELKESISIDPPQQQYQYTPERDVHRSKLAEISEIEVVDTTKGDYNINSTPINKVSNVKNNGSKKTCCQRHCSHRGARIFYWFGMVVIVAGLVGLYFSIVNLYQPAVKYYHQDTCRVNRCADSDVDLTCCTGSGATRQCITRSYTSLNYTFVVNQTSNFTKREVHDCNGPLGQDSWEYPGMCADPLLKTVKCYYDERDVFKSLHLTNAYQFSIEVINAIIAISVCVFLMAFWIIYSFAYCVCFQRIH